MTISVLLADDQDLVRAGVRMILDAEEDLRVIGEATDGTDAVTKARRLRPDVAVMDIRMPGTDGVEATRQLSALDPPLPTRILILTTYDLDEYVFAALRAGASGFMLKHAPPEDLVAAIRTVASGDGLLAPRVTRRVIEAFADVPERPAKPPAQLDRLTDREREIFDLVVRGRSNADIAKELYVEPSTVKTHVAHALNKLNLSDRLAAVIFAYESGLLAPGETGRSSHSRQPGTPT
ncbi:MAG TPA: response regulator transcription factor [Jiangellaceae bacterium]